MKIEMNKKYKTRSGENVTIQRTAFGKAYGIIECDNKDGLFTIWDENGEPIKTEMIGLYNGSLDLIEVKEDWELLIEHFKSSDGPLLIKIGHDLFKIHGVAKINYDGEYMDVCTSCTGDIIRILYLGVKLATLEDCKRYILEK